MDAILAGGQNRTDIFPITKDVTDGVTVYTVGTTLAHTYSAIEKVNVEPQEDGTLKLTVTQVEDSAALETHLDAFARGDAEDSSTITRQLIEGAHAWKWDLVNLLPGDHPYKNSPPTV